MIVSPTSDISEEEKTELLDYLEAGGKAMIFSDYTQMICRTLMRFLKIMV